MRRSRLPAYTLPDGSVDLSYLGVVRDYSCRFPNFGNRGSTPLKVTFFSLTSVKIYNVCARDGRAVLYLDGTKSQVRWGIVLKDNDICQRWELTIGPSFLLASSDPNKILTKEIGPQNLMEFHSIDSSAEALQEPLREFFYAQLNTGLVYYRPLIVKMDCAGGLPNAILKALCFKGSPVPNKILYANVIILFLGWCEKHNWDTEVTKKASENFIQLLPTCVHQCRYHVVDAALKWTFHWYHKFFDNIMVHFALALYVFEKSHFPTKRIDLVAIRQSPEPSIIKAIEDEIVNFCKSECDRITNYLSDAYGEIHQGSTFSIINTNRTTHETPKIVDQVLRKARAHQLVMGCTYCTGHQDGISLLRTNVCIGFYPDFPNKKTKPVVELDLANYKPRWITSIPSTSEFSENARPGSNNVFVPNPIAAPSLISYLRDWLPSIPLFSCGVLSLCSVDAEVDNTNNLQEARFGASKSDNERLLHSSDPGLFTIWKERNIRLTNKLWGNQMCAIGWIVDKSNFHKGRKNWEVGNDLTVDEAREIAHSKQMNPWLRKVDKIQLLAEDLLDLVTGTRFMEEHKCRGDEHKRHHSIVEDFVTRNSREAMIQERSFTPWLLGSKKSGSRMRDGLFQQITSFVDHYNEKYGTTKKSLRTISIPYPTTTQVLVPELPSMESIELELECDVKRVISEKMLNMVLHDRQDDQVFVDTIREYRKNGRLIIDTENRRMPKIQSAQVDKLIKEAMDNPEKCRHEFARCGEGLDVITFTDEELDGEITSDGDGNVVMVDDRKIIGFNIPPDDLVTCSRYSIVKRFNSIPSIVQNVFDTVPQEIFPKENDNRQSLIERISMCMWLDEIWKHKGESPLNENRNSKQCVRRTASKVWCMPQEFVGPSHHPANGKIVTGIYLYPMAEQPQHMQMCRPMSKMEEAFVGMCWRTVWENCSVVSRSHPQNAYQACVYHRVYFRRMNPHRDNNSWLGMKKLANGVAPDENKSSHAGFDNSQRPGSSVIIYSMGTKPMRMTFSYPSPHLPITQSTKEYISLSPVFSMEIGNGYLSVLDDVDDTMMLHEVFFEGTEKEHEGNPRDMRIAWVMRRLENKRYFYADTSTIVLSPEEIASSRSSSTMVPSLPRGVFT